MAPATARASSSNIDDVAQGYSVERLIEREMWRGSGEMLPDELKHQELVEIGVEQGTRDGIEFPVVVMRAPSQVDDHYGANCIELLREAASVGVLNPSFVVLNVVLL